MRQFDSNAPLVKFKLDILKHAMPAQSAIVFGDMYIVEGGYTLKCLEWGCETALLVDTLETVDWFETRKQAKGLDFYKGDFSNPFFMQSFNQQFEIGLAFDILLHQAPLLHTIHLMLEKVTGRFCIAQPMLREQTYPNTLIYLPGNTAQKELYPLNAPAEDFRVFDPKEVNHGNWLWAMTPSFLKSVLIGEGFEITYQAQADHFLPNPNWCFWGCVAERREVNPRHWSTIHRPTAGHIHDGRW